MSIKNLRAFHTSVKSHLLSHTRMGDSLLDLGIGLGNDYKKWINHGFQRIVGIEINKYLIEESKRYLPFFIQVINFDLNDHRIDNYMSHALNDEKFSTISCHFVIQYIRDLNHFFKFIYNHLEDNGSFIGTFVVSERVKKILDKPTKLYSFQSLNEKTYVSTIVGSQIDMISRREATEYIHDIDDILKHVVMNNLKIVNLYPFDIYDYEYYNLSRLEKDISFINFGFVIKKNT